MVEVSDLEVPPAFFLSKLFEPNVTWALYMSSVMNAPMPAPCSPMTPKRGAALDTVANAKTKRMIILIFS